MRREDCEGRGMLNWKVEIVKIQKLQETMNAMEQDGYEIDKYEHVADTFDGPDWIVVGWKPVDEE